MSCNTYSFKNYEFFNFKLRNKEMKKEKTIKIKAYIIEDGKWATDQMLVYKTQKSAQERVCNGGMSKVWRVFPCEIIIKYP